MTEPLLTIANVLTLLRMAVAPFVVILVLQQRYWGALLAFVLAGLTDLFDGYVARHGSQSTTLGAMLDPVADKILLSCTFVALTWASRLRVPIPEWLTVLTLSRDTFIVISVVVINLTVGRRVFYPSLLGKVSTVCQLLTVGFVLLVNARDTPGELLEPLFLATGSFAVASGLHYVYAAASGRHPVHAQPGPTQP